MVGSAVTGSYQFPVSPGVFGPTNLFDPVNGEVPSGYGNSTGTSVVIADPLIEFAALNGGGTIASPGIASISADFSASTLNVQERINYSGGLTGFRMTFQDASFNGLSVVPGASTFGQGGLTAVLSGDTLTLTIAPNCVIGPGCTGWPAVQDASFAFAPIAPVPLPAAGWLLLSGLGGLSAVARKRPRVNAS
jgi:hypothetical protein